MQVDFKILLITLHDLAPAYQSEFIPVTKSSRYNQRSTDDLILLQYSRTKSWMFAFPE